MASAHQPSSSSSTLLPTVAEPAHTPAYSGGSQSGGSEHNPRSPHTPDIDSLLRSGIGIASGPAGLLPSNALSGYGVGNSSLPAHNYGGTYDAAAMPSSTSDPASQHRSMAGDDTPTRDHHNRFTANDGSISAAKGQSGTVSAPDTANINTHRQQSTAAAEASFDSHSANRSNEAPLSPVKDDDANRNDDGHGLPPWSELRTKAGKERKRLPLACIACRRKKIRCSGENPACKHCLRSRIPCVYKVTTRKAAPRTDYMAMLDKRLRRMEERVIRIIPKEDHGILAAIGRANVKPPLPAPPGKGVALSNKRHANQAFDDLEDWADPSSTTAETKPLPTYDSAQDPLKARETDEQSLLCEGAGSLPPKEIQEHLAEIFFDYVHGQSYHLLHRPSFMRKLGQGQVAPVLLLAVCAISARFSTHPALATEPAFLRGESWAAAAREISLKRYDAPNITILIVYLILTLHEFGTCQGGRSWMFGGMAQRMAYALQLHQDLDHDPKSQPAREKSELTFTDREIRRRTMWACFLMDRFCSSGTERPTFVAVDHIRAQLPICEYYFNMEVGGPTEDLNGNVPNPASPDSGHASDAKENMGVAAYTVRLVAVWGELINYINLGGKQKDEHEMWEDQSKFNTLRRAVRTWKDTLPDKLQYRPDNLAIHVTAKIANQFIFMHIIYNQVVLFMNRFALPSPGGRNAFPKDMPRDFIEQSAKAALDAANDISSLVNQGMDHRLVAPFAGYSAFFSSTVHIFGVFSKNPALEASSKENLAWNLTYLTRMKKHWGMFHFMTENLRDLYRKHADAARSSSSGGEDVAKDGEQIFQYGDWFDRYPHGVSGTMYEEPRAEVKTEPGADAVLGQQSDLQTVEDFFANLTPPGRATHPRRPRPRKLPKKQHSKGEGLEPGQSNPPPQQQQQQQQQPVVVAQTAEQRQVQQSASDMLGHQIGQNDMPYPQAPPAFASNFQPQATNPLLAAPQQPGVLSQLDRQMVLASYGGMGQAGDLLGAAADPALAAAPSASGMSFDLDFGAMTDFARTNASWADPSASAWFMPFNLAPPMVGDEGPNGLFDAGSGTDWSAGYGGGGNGSGDFSALQPTGLTPRPAMELDAVHEARNNGGSNGMDRL